MLFFEILLLVILLLCLRVSWSYIMLIMSKRNADKGFNKLFDNMKEYLLNVRSFLEEIKTLEGVNSDVINETEEFISKLLGFSFEKDGNERIIGYANAIYLNIEKLLPAIDGSDACAKYNSFASKFEQEKSEYNKIAKKLRHYVDVFPSSFIARLKGIKTFDYIR